jgi:methylase of polypeptide subunit release factors
MSIARHHAEWLSLVEVSGPFLSLPVLLDAFPQGLPARDPEASKETKLMFEDWLDGHKDRAVHIDWCNFVIRNVLKFPPEVIAEGQTIPPGMEAHMSEFGEVLRPSMAILPPKGAASPKPRLLIQTLPPDQNLEKPLKDKHWKASPATRMTELLHAADVPLGLVTNGEHWMLVHAPRGETSGFASWFAPLWFEEPLTFQAFQSLLSVERFFGVPNDQTIEALLNESAKDQQEVTDQLGWQVRKAVEVLIQSLDKIDQDHDRKLLGGVGEKQLYEAALTIMMRLVFLMCAEERKILFPSDCQDYQDFYAISTLRDQLQEVADKHVEEVLDARFDAWGRLLATFRAVYGGVQHEAMRLPPYGGTLFDPDRFPFLEGRKPDTSWRNTPAEPLKVSNRTVLHLLNALQILQVKVPGGGAAEARRISFRALDIEQIGHVYEGLLDHTAKRATEPVLGLKGGKDSEVEVALSELEALKAKGADELVEFLKEETGRSDKSLKKAITDEELIDEQALLIACGHDRDLANRVRPYAALLREDTLGYPVVINTGSIYVTQGSDRRSTGTHYTPRSLTEPIVQHTLEPLVYVGPTEGQPKSDWKLRTPREILALKVCDMTMGSGAFLVQTCRYLAERLAEAWENAEKANPGKILSTPEGDFSEGDPAERIIPTDPAERLAIARRYVADRCLYGVDINPMAVEMAKLSLWLITLQRDRPFTFLDHALKSGDSLLGVGMLKQIENFSLRATAGEIVQHTFATANLFRYVDEATTKRRALEDLPSNDHTQIETKNRLHAEAEAATTKVKALADTLIAFEMLGLDGEAYQERRAVAADHAEVAMRKPPSEFRAYAQEQLRGRRPFHWPVEFPEVFARGGFDAFVGNPPFLGGTRISTELGDDYLRGLSALWGRGNRADLCAYFFLQTFRMGKSPSIIGLLATNSVGQGDTREFGIERIVQNGGSIIYAIPSMPWPGVAAIQVALVVTAKGDWRGNRVLNSSSVALINSFLDAGAHAIRSPDVLASNEGKVFQGSKIYSDGFLLSPAEAKEHVRAFPAESAVIRPYLDGRDVNTHPCHAPSRFVIDFREWLLDEARKFPVALSIVENRVRPEREQSKYDDLRQHWWQFQRVRREMYESIGNFSKVLVTARVSPTCAIAVVPTGMVLNEKLIVFGFDQLDVFAVLQSEFHWSWARQYTSTLGETTLNYSPTDCFVTFAFPAKLNGLESVGERYQELRSQIMQARQEGLTKTYNRFHDEGEKSEDIARLRALHMEMDRTVAASYGWSDLNLDHGFHETKQGVRYTLSESARRTVLDRLLALNHQRYAEEVKAGLHEKGARKPKKARQAPAKPAIERPLLTGFRFAVSDPTTYSVNLVVALLSEAGGSLPWPHLRDAFVFATRPDLMKQYAAPVDAQRVAVWAQRWNEKALPKLLPPALRALGRRNLLIQPQGADFIFQLPDGPKPPSSEEVGYDAWLALRVSRGLNNLPVPLPESEQWIEDVRQLASAA